MDTVARFDKRVENYVKYRPSYPSAAIDFLERECRLTQDSVIADIGSGTGIFSKLLLDQGFQVIGVEPGDAMRAAAEASLNANPHFTSVARKAEDTGLEESSIDLITIAQAFHWMDIPSFRAESQRILKPGGWVAIIWNRRRTTGKPLLEEYEALLASLETDCARVNHANVTQEAISEFYGKPYQYTTFPNEQVFDWDGLLGRVLSSSYVPLPNDPGYAAMAAELRRIFDAYSQNGTVAFEYETQVYLGQM